MIIKENLDEIQNYLSDSSNLKGFCQKVYIPENVDELIDCIKELYQNDVPYTISGAGTGLVGGRVPFDGVVVSTEKLNRILEINEEEQYVVVEAGVVRSDLDSFLESKGFFLPPNPTETSSFIGGNIACNSSGSRTFKYGTMRDYVLALDIVLPDGEKVSLERNNKSLVVNCNYILEIKPSRVVEFKMPEVIYPNTTKNTAGYYLHRGMHTLDLFIGSEGTLGTITQAKIKILPKPSNVLGLIIFFDDLPKAFDFLDLTRKLSRKSFNGNNQTNDHLISARLIEFFDKNSLMLNFEEYPQIPKGSVCAFWTEQEYEQNKEEQVVSAWLEHIAQFTPFTDQTWVAIEDSKHREFAEFRHKIPVKVFEMLSQSQFQKIGSDVATNDAVFRNYYFKLLRSLENSGLVYFIWGHFGNSHLHLNIIPRNEQENQLAEKIFDEHIAEAIMLGGTYSAEHGTGKLKRKYFQMMFGSEIVQKMKEIKLKFDPKNLLNRGVLFF